jgi:hypothetical protein
MEVENFDYLTPYVSPGKKTDLKPRNWFYPLTETDIRDGEEKLGFKFPSQLRNFYQKIGYGSLKVPHNPPEGYKFFSDNYINPPSILADIILLGHDSGYISQDVLDFMEPGDLPFFHIADSCLFLMMRPNSDNPNAVYNQWGDLVEENFDQFIWRLYHESPTFYEEAQKS